MWRTKGLPSGQGGVCAEASHRTKLQLSPDNYSNTFELPQNRISGETYESPTWWLAPYLLEDLLSSDDEVMLSTL